MSMARVQRASDKIYSIVVLYCIILYYEYKIIKNNDVIAWNVMLINEATRRDFYLRVFDLVIENHIPEGERNPHVALFRRDSLVTRYHLLEDWKSPTCSCCGSRGFACVVPFEGWDDQPKMQRIFPARTAIYYCIFVIKRHLFNLK